MKQRLTYATFAAVLLLNPLTLQAADLPPGEEGGGGTETTGSVSENVSGNDGGTVIDIPGWGSISQKDIDELAGYTREATGEYWDQNREKPMVIVREPDLEMTYDTAYERYRYTLPDGQWIECNVPQGAFCRGSVDFTMSEGITGVTHFRDGSAGTGRGPFLESGSYVMTFWDLNVFGDANRAYRVDYCFTIYSDHHLNLTHVEAPGGMEVSELWYEDTPQELLQTRYVQAMQDGKYHIVFSVPESSSDNMYDSSGVSYEMDFIRDTTPPVIDITPEYRFGIQMNSEVNYRIEEQGAKLTILRNHVEVELPKGNIPVNGDYKLKVEDQCGNARVYAFSVKAPVAVFSKKMLLIPAGLLLAALAAAAYWRRNMRVI